MDSPSPNSDPLTIGGRQFNSRLFTGTGKYPSMTSMQQSIERSSCDMVTVAVRRVQTVAAGHEGLMEAIDWQRIWMLPNTAGCTNAGKLSVSPGLDGSSPSWRDRRTTLS